MKNLLYVGNHLQSSQSNASYSAVLGPLLTQSGYALHYASNKTNKIFRLFDMLWTTFKNRKTTEIVLIDTYSTQNFYYAVAVSQLCRLLKLPYLPILHGGNLPHRLKTAPKLCKLLFSHSHTNIAPSLYLKQQFEHFGYKNCVHIPNTIQLNTYPYHAKRFDVPKILWVRSFSEIYNPALAIEVVHELKQRGVNANLCMVGPDPNGLLPELQALAKHLAVSVTCTGKLTKSEWIHISKDYNVFMNTTTVDNMPVSVIEAMALGLPVVSTNVGGIPYLITDAVDGLLVPSNNKVAMADAIASLFNDIPKTKRMVEAARLKVSQYDWQLISQLWKSVLK